MDGGVDTTNAGRIVGAGATMLVAGSALFSSPTSPAAIRDLRAAAETALLQ